MERYEENSMPDQSAASIKVVFSDGQSIEVIGMNHFCQCLIKELRTLNFKGGINAETQAALQVEADKLKALGKDTPSPQV